MLSDPLVITHTEILEFCFGYTYRIEGADMAMELGDKFGIIGQPGDVVSRGQVGFEPIQRSAFEIGQGIGNLGTIISERVGSVSEIKEALSQEGLKFLGVQSIEWVGLLDSGEGQAPGLGRRSGSRTRAKVGLPDSGEGRAPGLG